MALSLQQLHKKIEEYGAETQKHKGDIEYMRTLMFFVVIVLLVGFVTILVGYLTLVADYNRDKAISYNELKNTVENTSSSRLDSIEQSLQKLQNSKFYYQP